MIIFPQRRRVVAYLPPAARAGSPVTLQLAKLHLRAGGCYDAASADAYTAEDATIALYLAAATQEVEDVLGRGLLTQQWTMTASGLDSCGGFTIEGGPIQNVAPSVQALVSGSWQTLSPTLYAWRWLARSRMSVKPAAGATWPTADVDDAAWRVTFTTGYGAASDVPAQIIRVILLLTQDGYENRDAMNPGNAGVNPAVERILSSNRTPNF
ncbi:head-tail connector protein [Methylocella silvestris]|uniref:Uncharacterized protein n=1 Tax=Methylocella silvestris TaxID=199596 RepID=A0A2J7TJR1_METSI|nr:hypothetical protein [Methylocella silvestris]PNG27008.1 hypothetical protein CR492_04710 [Methylocella silvestris]